MLETITRKGMRPAPSDSAAPPAPRREAPRSFSRHRPSGPCRRAPPSARRACSSDKARGDPVDVVGRRDDARAGLTDQLRRRASAARRRGSAARPPGTRTPSRTARPDRAARLGNQEQERVGVALERERSRRGTGGQLEPVAQAERLRPTRGRATRKSPTKRATTSSRPDSAAPQKRPRVALAEEAAGVRDPEAVARVYSIPAKSSKSPPLVIVTTRRRIEARVSSAIASEARDDRVGLTRDEPRDAGSRLLLHARARRSDVAVRVRAIESRRSATQRAPVDADRGADQMHRARRRRRQHDVDLVGTRDPHRRRDRGGVPRRRSRPAGAGAGESEARLHREAVDRHLGRAGRPRDGARADRDSERGGSTPASAAPGRDRSAATSDRPVRAPVSRSRAPAGAWRT